MIKDPFAPSGNAAKFETPGKINKGTVTSVEVRQQRDFVTGELKTFEPSGDPRNEVLVGLLTEDGEHLMLYCRGQMVKAISEAVAAVKAPTVEVGGVLAVKYVSDGEQKRAGFSPPKIYAAQYAPPPTADTFATATPTDTATATVDDLI